MTELTFRLLLVGGIAASLVFSGYKFASNACKAEKAESIARAIEQEREIARQNAEIAGVFEENKERIVTKYKIIERNIPNETPDCAITNDGLRMLNDAIRGNTPAATGKPDRTLRKAGSIV